MNKKYLISSVSAMVLLLANPVSAEETAPDLSNKPITTPTLDYLGETSAYEITKGTESDYSFINLVADSEGKITKEYYKINLTGPKSVTWSDTGDHEISLNLPNSETPTNYKYSINPDAALGTRIDNDLTQDKVDGKLFANIQSEGTKHPSYSEYYGGVIYNTVDNENVNIISDFIGNSLVISGENKVVNGGAIANYGKDAKMGNIIGDFTGNYAKSESYNAHGGAISNNFSTIGNITGDFIGNYAQGSSSASGGAIYNDNGIIGDITGTFIGNYATSELSDAQGGAIAHNGLTNTNIFGDFIGNYAQGSSAYGGAIYSSASALGDISGNFIGNYALGSEGAWGGAIYKEDLEIGHIAANFIGNHAISMSGSAGGGAISTGSNEGKNSITGDFIGNYAQGSSSAYGGAIDYFGGDMLTLIDASFFNNYVSGNEDSYGGAIYSDSDMKIIADNGKSEFTGNYVLADGEKTENAVYMDSKTSTLTLNAENNGKILFNDEIDGIEGYAVALTGDDTGTIDFNNDIRNANISLEKATVNVSKGEYLNNNNALAIKSGVMNIADLGEENVHFTTFEVANGGTLNIGSITADLEKQTMGRISADTTIAGTGVINVNNILLTSDGDEGDTPVLFADDGFKTQVQTTVTETIAPIYKYSIAYDAETGEFVFTRGDLVVPDDPEPTPGGDDDDNKPSVPVTPIVRPTGYKAFNPGVFANDIFAMSALNVQGNIMNQVAVLPENFDYSKARVWAIPYYSDDTLSFSGFYDVDSTNYGLIAGVDSKAYGNVDGWTRVYTAFGAYNDGENKYQGVKVDTKSWLVGLKASVFNGGFYGDALVNYAWHDSDQTTAFGKDSVDTEGYGAALKAGYKHDFERITVDGSVMLSWQQVEGKNFTSKSGARFDTDDYSRLSLVPQIKVGYNLRDIRPYALARYNFALSEDGSTTVNHSLALPEIESKDYVEYGLGIETANTDNHSGYAHVLRHDGGREGWSVTAGYRYNI